MPGDMASTAKQKQARMREVVGSFLSVLKGLMNDFIARVDVDAHVRRAQQRMILGSDATPTRMVDILGLALYRHKDSIYAEEETEWKKFFQPGTSKLDEELRQTQDAETRVDAEHIVPIVQRVVYKLDNRAQKGYLEQVRRALDLYLEYLTLTE
jgi:hypothetical protein